MFLKKKKKKKNSQAYKEAKWNMFIKHFPIWGSLTNTNIILLREWCYKTTYVIIYFSILYLLLNQ